VNSMPAMAATLWSYYQAWAYNNFKNIDSDGERLRPRPSKSRMRRLKSGDYGSAMSLLNRYKVGSTELEELA